MAFDSSMSFTPLHNAGALIETDHRALADQLSLCHTERRRGRGWGVWVQPLQAFAAQRLMSSLLLLVMASGTAFWLVG